MPHHPGFQLTTLDTKLKSSLKDNHQTIHHEKADSVKKITLQRQNFEKCTLSKQQ